ncbi:MAG: hypothetical protein ACI38B_01555 [Bifidobacterium sp.]|uniref:hypothetical protein n=1 Tax=Bifidobacterium sp. TaxID=41200 RepID=UPI003F0E7121
MKYQNVNIFNNAKMLTQNQNICAGNRDDNECSFSAVSSNGPSENAEIPPLCRYNESTETADKGVPPAPPYVPADNGARHIAIICLGDISISRQNGFSREIFRTISEKLSIGTKSAIISDSPVGIVHGQNPTIVDIPRFRSSRDAEDGVEKSKYLTRLGFERELLRYFSQYLAESASKCEISRLFRQTWLLPA